METPLRPADVSPVGPELEGCSRRALLACGGTWAAGAVWPMLYAGGLQAAPVGSAPPTGLLPPVTGGAASSPGTPQVLLRSAAQSGALVKYAPGDAVHPGLCAEIAAAVQRLDPQLHILGLEQPVPLRRLELMLASDELDVFFCLLSSERRKDMMRFLPVPLYRVRHVLVMRAGMPMPQSWTALRAFARQRPLLVVQGTQLAVALKQADVAHVETARSEHDALQMLLRGRTDAVYGQDLGLRQAVRAAGLDEQRIQFSATAFDEQSQFVVVSRKLPEAVVERLTERVRQLQASGELARIVDRYR